MAAVNKRLEILEFEEPLVIAEKPIPAAPKKGVVVKVHYAGVCHSDIHIWRLGKHVKGIDTQLVMGHEIAGTVFEFGEEASRNGLNVGDNVVVYPWGACGNCSYCQKDKSYVCPNTQSNPEFDPTGAWTLGVYADGGFQNYVSVPDTSMVIPVPLSVPLDQACMVPCSGITAHSAVTSIRSAVEEAIMVNGQAAIAVVGTGGLGLWGIQFCKALYPDNVQICAVDISEEKLKDAKEAGADVTVCWDKESEATPKAIGALRVACGRKIDAGIDFTGTTDSVARLVYASESGATITIVGMAGQTMPPIPLPFLILRGVRLQSVCTGSRADVKRVIELYAQGKVKPPPVTLIKLEDVNDILQKLISCSLKGRAVVQL